LKGVFQSPLVAGIAGLEPVASFSDWVTVCKPRRSGRGREIKPKNSKNKYNDQSSCRLLFIKASPRKSEKLFFTFRVLYR
jgi:hypothetical protein